MVVSHVIIFGPMQLDGHSIHISGAVHVYLMQLHGLHLTSMIIITVIRGAMNFHIQESLISVTHSGDQAMQAASTARHVVQMNTNLGFTEI